MTDTTSDADAGANAGDSATCDELRCYCPMSGLMETLGHKYALQLVCVVGAHGTVRFSDIEGHLPAASTSTLSARLDELEGCGLVTRTQYDEIPPRVEYELTDEGLELQEHLEPLLEWVQSRDRGQGS